MHGILPPDHDVIQCTFFTDHFSLMIDSSSQHHAGLDLISALQQSIQGRENGIPVYFRQVPQRSQIHPEERNLSVHHVVRSPDQSSVTPEHDDSVGILRYIVRLCAAAPILRSCAVNVNRSPSSPVLYISHNRIRNTPIRILGKVRDDKKILHSCHAHHFSAFLSRALCAASTVSRIISSVIRLLPLPSEYFLRYTRYSILPSGPLIGE